MKSEYEIAKENVKNINEEEKYSRFWRLWKLICERHKETCQRILKFLEDSGFRFRKGEEQIWINKITNLKQAIKEYDKNGI